MDGLGCSSGGVVIVGLLVGLGWVYTVGWLIRRLFVFVCLFWLGMLVGWLALPCLSHLIYTEGRKGREIRRKVREEMMEGMEVLWC